MPRLLDAATAMRAAIVVSLVICMFSESTNAAIRYTGKPSLTQFPHDISLSVKKIKITGTSITTIDYIEPFPNLETLELFDNKLVMFPDLTNISSTLLELNLFGNMITAIDYIPPMSALTTLNVASNALTQLPDLINVSSTLQVMEAYNNTISVIRYIPLMPRLTKFTLASNRLTHFPDLINISNSIARLSVKDNNISVVDYVHPMPRLTVLDLENNALTEFPDLQNMSATLEILNLKGNDIHTISNHLVIGLTGLEKFQIGRAGGDPIRMPNACYMGRKKLTLTIHTDQVICDAEMVYAKLAESSGALTVNPKLPSCSAPPRLANKLYDELTIAELLNTQMSEYHITNY